MPAAVPGGGYFASLRAQASSREPRVSFSKPQKSSVEKWHNALIWYMRGASIMPISEKNGTTFSYRTKGNQTLAIFSAEWDSLGVDGAKHYVTKAIRCKL